MSMEKIYNEILDFVTSSGRRIIEKAGKIKDIGIVKEYLTEEDLAIERGLKEIIKNYDESHELFAEEENDDFPEVDNIWVADPISGTKTFIKGLPHYGIAVAHTKNREVQFSVVYDPSIDELFTAYLGKGAFLNEKPIKVSNNNAEINKLEIIYNLSKGWKDKSLGRKMFNELTQFRVFRNTNSFAVNYCHVACGRYDGVIAFTKDAFPEIASSLIVREAGGIFVNKNQEKNIRPGDRTFVGGNKYAFEIISPVLEKIL